MNKVIGLALLAAGIALVIYGVNASHSMSSAVSRTINGTPTNQTLWFLIGGSVAIVVGAALAFIPSRKI